MYTASLLLPLFLSLVSASPIVKRATNQLIKANSDGLCLSAPGTPADGLPVISVPCSQATGWDISPGSGSVVLTGTNFALDAGSYPGNNGPLKIWTSYPGLYQQTWYLTGDNRIAITGGNQCLDEGTNGIQTYQCTTGNTNQIFYISPASPTSSTSSAPSTSSTPSAPTYFPSIPSGITYQDPPPGNGRRLHPYGRGDLCVTVQNGYAAVGTNVAISYCVSNNDTYAPLQLWDIDTSNLSSPQEIKLHGVQNGLSLCLDAGETQSDGSGVSVNSCGNGISNQAFTYSGIGVLSINNGYYCVDVKAESGPGTQKPYNSLKDLQIYQCFAGNTNQIFFELAYPN